MELYTTPWQLPKQIIASEIILDREYENELYDGFRKIEKFVDSEFMSPYISEKLDELSNQLNSRFYGKTCIKLVNVPIEKMEAYDAPAQQRFKINPDYIQTHTEVEPEFAGYVNECIEFISKFYDCPLHKLPISKETTSDVECS